MESITVSREDANAHIRAYRARAMPEYSDARKHVYFIPSTRMYLILRAVRGGKVEMEFTSECPCVYDD